MKKISYGNLLECVNEYDKDSYVIELGTLFLLEVSKSYGLRSFINGEERYKRVVDFKAPSISSPRNFKLRPNQIVRQFKEQRFWN